MNYAIQQALQKILNYLCEEEADFEGRRASGENVNNHIFIEMTRVQKWLDDQQPPPAEEGEDEATGIYYTQEEANEIARFYIENPDLAACQNIAGPEDMARVMAGTAHDPKVDGPFGQALAKFIETEMTAEPSASDPDPAT